MHSNATITDAVTRLNAILEAEGRVQETAAAVTSNDDMIAALVGLDIDACTTRFHRAMQRYRDGENVAEALQEAVDNERKAREMWLNVCLAPWCERHGITLLQGLSIAFDDNAFNPVNPDKDQPTLDGLFKWGGQQNNFAPRVKLELLAKIKHLSNTAEMLEKLATGRGTASFANGLIQFGDASCFDLGKVFHPTFALIQEGGASTELYLHALPSQEDADEHRVDCADNGSYRTTPSVEIPPALAALGETFYQSVESLIQSQEDLALAQA